MPGRSPGRFQGGPIARPIAGSIPGDRRGLPGLLPGGHPVRFAGTVTRAGCQGGLHRRPLPGRSPGRLPGRSPSPASRRSPFPGDSPGRSPGRLPSPGDYPVDHPVCRFRDDQVPAFRVGRIRPTRIRISRAWVGCQHPVGRRLDCPRPVCRSRNRLNGRTIAAGARPAVGESAAGSSAAASLTAATKTTTVRLRHPPAGSPARDPPPRAPPPPPPARTPPPPPPPPARPAQASATGNQATISPSRQIETTFSIRRHVASQSAKHGAAFSDSWDECARFRLRHCSISMVSFRRFRRLADDFDFEGRHLLPPTMRSVDRQVYESLPVGVRILVADDVVPSGRTPVAFARQ